MSFFTEGMGGTIVFLVLMFSMVYFVLIRPQRKRQKEHEELTSDLKKGNKVRTAGGIYGVLETVGEETVVLKVESGATMRVAKDSIIGKMDIMDK
jgi:preprotein translocase subunit YajC